MKRRGHILADWRLLPLLTLLCVGTHAESATSLEAHHLCLSLLPEGQRGSEEKLSNDLILGFIGNERSGKFSLYSPEDVNNSCKNRGKRTLFDTLKLDIISREYFFAVNKNCRGSNVRKNQFVVGMFDKKYNGLTTIPHSSWKINVKSRKFEIVSGIIYCGAFD